MAIAEDPPPSVPEWVVTFGDMMSLLLTFFIMLVSMSEMKQDEKFQAMLESMRRQFGNEQSLEAAPGEHAVRNSSMTSFASLARAKRLDIMQGGNKVQAVSGEHSLVQSVRQGRNSTIGGVVDFPEDSAELGPEGQDQLKQIAQKLAGKPQMIEIRGHTSRRPVAEGDHYDLAFGRCRAAMRALVAAGIDPERIRLSSAGANEPIDDGLAADSRARNARIEVLMWDEPAPDSAAK